MAILRQEPKDYGGFEVWDDRDPDTPVYVPPHLLNTHTTDGTLNATGESFVATAIAARRLNQNKDALLEKMEAAEMKLQDKLAGLFDEARQYVEDHYPNATGAQLKTQFVNRIKTWIANWTGD